ncbi:MAG: hypothetical protein U0Y82_14970 [Thermoleophilia bacterium]
MAVSACTAVQAFRFRRAWGLLFHAEADAQLIERWIAEHRWLRTPATPVGAGSESVLRAAACQLTPERGDQAFPAFAALV